VAGRVHARRRPEHAAKQVRVLRRDVEQVLLPRRLKVCDGRFDQVPGVVRLVAAGVLVFPALRAETSGRLLRIDRPRRLEVAVGLLRLADDRDQIVELRGERRIGMVDERKGRGLDDLVDVRVVEPPALIVALFQSRAFAQIIRAPGLLVLIEDVRNRDGAIGLHLLPPESAGHFHGRHRHGNDRILSDLDLALGKQRSCAENQEKRNGFDHGYVFLRANLSPDQMSLIAHTL
jgi:hypothetical protein